MRGATIRDKATLRVRETESAEDDVFLGFVGLAETVFGAPPSPPWPVWALFDPAGGCVAGLQCGMLRMRADEVSWPVAALRNVAVAPEWRGRGLMRDLVQRVLAWCDDGRAELVLLYAETAALYLGLGFAPVPQHAFEGPAPAPLGAATARLFDSIADADTLTRLSATSAALSSRCCLVEDAGLRTQALRSGEWQVSLDAALDALIAWEVEGDTLVVVDVVAAHVPSAARILGALGVQPARLRTLFSPDRLDWTGVPVADEAGLMVRGALPPKIRRSPFMLPPTVAF